MTIIEEFIKRLSIETPLSQEDSHYIVTTIQDKVGSIDTAIKIYEHDGYFNLIFYMNQINARRNLLIKWRFYAQ